MNKSKGEIELERHNQLRAKHHTSPLVLSYQLCERAQSWEEHMNKSQHLQHSDCMLNGDRLGENVYFHSSGAQQGDATDTWYKEEQKYDYNNGEKCWERAGHFTQVVWRGSKEVGFGYSGGYVVANYYPAGNMMGTFKQNVLQP